MRPAQPPVLAGFPGWLAFAPIGALLAACAEVPERPTPGYAIVGESGETWAPSEPDPDASGPLAPRLTVDGGGDGAVALDPGLPKVWTAPPGLPVPCDNQQISFDFDRFESSFTANHAFWMMWFAMRAFVSEEPSTRDELAALGFGRFAHLDASAGLQAMVAASEDATLVSFRGSTEVEDYLNNAKFGLTDAADLGLVGQLHAGFNRALHESWAALYELVGSLADRGQPVWLTGHSLGGTMALVTAVKLDLAGFRVAGVYSFGGPRPGNRTFTQYVLGRLGTRSVRVVNHLDLAPRIPPASIAAEHAAQVLDFDPLEGWAAEVVEKLDYAHASGLYAFDEDSNLVYRGTPGDWEDTLFWSERAEHVSGVVGLVRDDRTHKERHHPGTYLCKLQALRAGMLVGTDPNP